MPAPTIFTKEQDAILIKHYLTKSIQEVCKLLPGVKRDTINRRARQTLGLIKNPDGSRVKFERPDLHSFNKRQLKFLLENFAHMTNAEIALKLKKTTKQIANKGKRLGLTKTSKTKSLRFANSKRRIQAQAAQKRREERAKVREAEQIKKAQLKAQSKPKPKVFETKAPVLEGKQKYYVPALRMEVYAAPGLTVDQVAAKYLTRK